MNYASAILAGSVILGLSLIVALTPGSPHAQAAASYQIHSSGAEHVWRLNAVTGAVSLCSLRKQDRERPVTCTPESGTATNLPR